MDAAKITDHLAKKLGFKLQRNYDNPEPPVFGIFRIEFNGVGDGRYEDFRVDREFVPGPHETADDAGRVFAFCKTAHRPYNAAVCAALVVLAHHLGDDIAVSSDGNDDAGPAIDWREAMAECQAVLGYGAGFKFKD